MQTLSVESSAIGNLITSYESIHPDTIVNDVVNHFFKSPDLDAVAIVEGEKVCGLVTRQKLFLTVFRRYGFELYGKKAIVAVAGKSPLVIHEGERLDISMDMALERMPQDVYDDVIVVDAKGCYKGLLSVKKMVIQQSHVLANSIIQKELAHTKARELERMSRMKSQFIAHVTHELRSPVNAIIMLTELLNMSCKKGFMDQMKDRLGLLMTSAVNLRTIIANVLDLSKIEAGKMEVLRENFDVAALLHEVAETTRVLVGNKPVTVEAVVHNGPVCIFSDPVKVRQILTNLTSNAAKFTEKGKIILSLFTKDDKLSISVSDTGQGIKEEDLEKLFTAFTQLEDTSTKRHEGTGLGLSICRNLADILGGSISLSSIFGEGTTFEVSLPLSVGMERNELHGNN